MKKLFFILLGVGALAVSSCDWWDYQDPWDPNDPNDPPCDTIRDPWDPGDTTNWGDTIIVDDPWDPGDTNWWDPRDTNGVGNSNATH